MSQPPYGSPPPGRGPAPGPYVPPTAYGPPAGGPEPPGRPLLPWLLLGGVLLLGGLGMLLALLLGGREDGDAPAADATATASVPGPGTSPPGTTPDPDGGRYEGSGQVAQAWVEAMRAGDHKTAFDLSCVQVQVSATASAPGGDAAEQLGAYFRDRVLDGDGFRAATLEGVDFDEASGTDVVSFTLTADDGRRVPLQVFVIRDGTVCDFL